METLVNLSSASEVENFKKEYIKHVEGLDPDTIQMHFILKKAAASGTLSDAEGSTIEEKVDDLVKYIIEENCCNVAVWRTTLEDCEEQWEIDFESNEIGERESQYGEDMLKLMERMNRIEELGKSARFNEILGSPNGNEELNRLMNLDDTLFLIEIQKW